METNKLPDPAWLAQAIRLLAQDAHRTLTRSPSAWALRKLSRRIGAIERRLGAYREGPLGEWLENLGREVRTAAPSRRGVSSSTHASLRAE